MNLHRRLEIWRAYATITDDRSYAALAGWARLHGRVFVLIRGSSCGA